MVADFEETSCYCRKQRNKLDKVNKAIQVNEDADSEKEKGLGKGQDRIEICFHFASSTLCTGEAGPREQPQSPSVGARRGLIFGQGSLQTPCCKHISWFSALWHLDPSVIGLK